MPAPMPAVGVLCTFFFTSCAARGACAMALRRCRGAPLRVHTKSARAGAWALWTSHYAACITPYVDKICLRAVVCAHVDLFEPLVHRFVQQDVP